MITNDQNQATFVEKGENSPGDKFSPILLIPLFCWIILIMLIQKPIYLLSAAYNIDSLVSTYNVIFITLGIIGFGGALKISSGGILLPRKILLILCAFIMFLPILIQILIFDKNIDKDKLKYILNSRQLIVDPVHDHPKSSQEIEQDIKSSYCIDPTAVQCRINTNLSSIITWVLLLGAGYMIIIYKYQGKRKIKLTNI